MSINMINENGSQKTSDKLNREISLEANYKNKQGVFHGITNEENSDFCGPLVNNDAQEQILEFHQVLTNEKNNESKLIVSPQSNSLESNRPSNIIQDRSKITSDYEENAGLNHLNRVNSNELNHDQSIISGIGSGFKGSSSVMQNNLASHNFDKLSGNINIQSYLKNNNNPSQSINNMKNHPTSSSQFKHKMQSDMVNGPEYTNSSNPNSNAKISKQFKETKRPSLTIENNQTLSNIKNMATIQISAVELEDTEISHELQKKAVFKLLRKFKLQQYAFRMDQYGFSDDIYKLSFLSHREREDLIDNLNMLPGHRERINDLFKVVEQLNPKCSLKQTMLNAIKQSKQENRKKQDHSENSNLLRSDSLKNQNRGRKEHDKIVTSDEDTVKNNKYSYRNISTNKNYMNDFTSGGTTQNSYNLKMQNRNKSSSVTKRSAATGKSIGVIHESQNFNVNQIYTPVLADVNASGQQFSTKTPHGINKKQIPNPLKKLAREQFMQNRQSTNTAARSLSKGKKKDRSEQSNSLNRIYNQLESKAKQALNQSFLNNIQQGRNYQNFHYALNNFANQSEEQKKAKKAIEQIFPMRKFVINHLEQKQKQMKQMQKFQHQDSSVSKKVSNSKEKKLRSDSKEINNNMITPYAQIQAQKIARTSNQNNRPPLANQQASAQKTAKKQLKPIPNFIQSNINFQKETESKLQNQSQTQFAKNENLRNQPNIGSHLKNQNILCINNDPYSEQNEKQYENNNYEKYESPDKPEQQINQRVKSGQKSEKFMQQRIRSSSQSQKKIINESQKNLFLQKTQQNQMTSHDEALFLSGNKKSMYRNSEIKQDMPTSKSKNSKERKIQNIRPPLGQKGSNKPEANVRQLLSNRQLNLSSLNNSQNKQAMQSSAYQSGNDSQVNLKSRQQNQSNQRRQGGSYNRNMNSLQALESTNKDSKNSLKNYILPDISSSRKAITESTTVNKKDSHRMSNSQLQRSSQKNNLQLSKQSDRDTLVKYEKFNQPSQIVNKEQNKTFEVQRQGSPQYSTPSVPDQSLIQNKVQAYKFENVITIESPNLKQSYEQLHLHAVNDLSQPLLDRQEHDYAKNLGNSFNSKKVAVGPVFFNLRIICDCLGRAIRRHIDYSQGTFWFLDQLHEAKQIQKLIKKEKTLKNLQKMLQNEQKQDLNIEESGSSDLTAFSYKFKDELKLSLRQNKDDYYNEDELERSGNLDDDQDDNPNSKSQFDKIKLALIKKSLLQEQDEVSEQSIDDIDIEVEQQLNLKEQKQIEEIRLQEMMKQTGTLISNNISTLNKSQESESNKEAEQFKDMLLKRPQVQISEQNKKISDKNLSENKNKNKQLQNKSYVQLQLIEKDKKIKELTKMVQMYETGKINRIKSPENIQEVMVIGSHNQMRGASSFRSKNEDENDEDIIKKYEADIYKMTRAEFLMSQIDLDPIESHYSQEQQQLSSNINHVRQNIINGIGSNRLQQNMNQEEPKNFKSAERAQDEQNNATNGQENNATMLDGSFNSVSQGRSLNQSSGQNGHQIIQSGELGEIIVDNNNTFKILSKPTQVDQSKKSTNNDLKSVSKSSQNQIKKQKPQEKNKKVDLGLQKQNSKLVGFSREEQLAILLDQLRYFDERMEFDDEIFHEDVDIIEPSSEDIAAYCKYVTIASKMENETPVIALVYIERILIKTGILINKYNWKRILVICLCVASKVWDDDSLENIHFPKVMSDVSLLMINKLEQIFLDLFLNYDLIVKGSEYAKYYFVMRTLADDLRDECLTFEEKNAAINDGRRKKKRRDEWAEFPLIKPISAMQMQQLQRNTAKAEIYLKDRHEKEIIFALGNKFKGPGQKSRQKRFMLNGAEDIINVKYTEQEYNQKKPRYVTSDQILSSTL